MSILHLEGAYENELAATGEFNPQAPKTVLTLPSGQRLVLPTEMLLRAVSTAAKTDSETEEATTGRTAVRDQTGAVHEVTEEAGAHEDTVIPLVAEELRVGKQEVETARVRVRRETEERMQTVNVSLTDVHWEIEHVPIEQRVETAPEMRQVGETTIFPLVEERMVVSRELWLCEEVHVRRVKTTVEKSADFAVKRDVLVEERTNS